MATEIRLFSAKWSAFSNAATFQTSVSFSFLLDFVCLNNFIFCAGMTIGIYLTI